MKKNLFGIQILILLMGMLVLSACGTSTDENDSAENTNGDGAGQSEEQQNTEEEKPVLQVATDAAFAPFEFMDKGEMSGFDVDLIEAVMAEAGYEYELKNVGWEPMLASTQNGEADLAIAGISINEDRQQTYDFSAPYFKSTHMIVFKDGTNITSAQDLNGLKIGVQTGTTGAEAAESIVGQNNENISKYETTTLAFMELNQGNVDAVVTDNFVAQEFLKNNPDVEVNTITDEENFESEYYAIMFPKGSEIADEISAALTTVIENGTYTEIYQEWFSGEPNTDELLNAGE